MVKLTKFNVNFPLLRTKLISFKELRWFGLSILITAMFFTVSSGFLLGFSQTELYTSGTSADVLTISEPKITPSQSRIPLYWVEDITELDGIESTSPETVDVIIDHTNTETPFFRGVTQQYKDIQNEFTILKGRWFSNDGETNSSLSKNEVIVGHQYATLLGLSVGDILVLQSRIRILTVDAVIVGIFQTNTVDDEGIIGPLWLGKMFNGLSQDLVNIIRLKFNPAMYTKTTLSSIILGKHLLEINIISNNTAIQSLNEVQDSVKVELYSRYKEKINETIANSGKAFFHIPFGKYFLKIFTSNFSSYDFTGVFLSENQSVDLYSYYRAFNLNITTKLSNNLLNKSIISVQHQYLGYSYNLTTNNAGFVSVFISEGLLKITVMWKSFTNISYLLLKNNMSYLLDMHFKAELEIKNSNTKNSTPISNVTIINLDNNASFQQKTDFNGKIQADVLPFTPYQIVITNSDFGRFFHVTRFNSSQPILIFIGNTSLQISLIDYDLGPVTNYPINLTIINDYYNQHDQLVLSSDDRGLINVSIIAGSIININTTYNDTVFHQELIQENNQELTFFIGKQAFNIAITSSENLSFNVSITNLISFQSINLTISLIKPVFHLTQFLEFGIYSISLSNDIFDFKYNKTFNFDSIIKNNLKIDLTDYNITGTEPPHDLISIYNTNVTFIFSYEFGNGVVDIFIILRSLTGIPIFSGSTTNFGNDVVIINLSMGSYTIEIFDKNYKMLKRQKITVENNTEFISIILSSTDDEKIIKELGSNLGKWTATRNYQLFDNTELSARTINNLGFSVVFFTLFLIVLVMTFFGLMTILHHPIYILRDSVKVMKFIGASNIQIKSTIAVQLSFLTLILASLGTFFGLFIMKYVVNFQKISIAGMIIEPSISLSYIPILGLSFSIVALVFSQKYISHEYFSTQQKP